MTPTPRIRQDTESAQKALSVKVPFTVPSRLITQSSSSLTDFGGGQASRSHSLSGDQIRVRNL